MLLIYTFFAFGEPEEWTPFHHEETLLEDPAEGYGAIDIVGPMEWSLFENELYIRFDVETAVMYSKQCTCVIHIEVCNLLFHCPSRRNRGGKKLRNN